MQTEHPTRARIAIAAEPLFARYGFDGVSVRAIAAAAEVQIGLINYHFGSKEGLYRALWEYWISKVPAQALLDQIPVSPDPTLHERLGRIVTAFFNGPRRLLQDDRGRNFLSMMVREANDPKSEDRGLLGEFLFPQARIFRIELANSLPNADEQQLAAGFEMMVSALRIVIEQGPSGQIPGSRDHVADDRLFEVLSGFVVRGLVGLADD